MPTKIGPFICKQCSNEFMGQKGNKNHFCCAECFDEFRSTKEERSCQICGAAFMAKQSAIRRGGGKYCSRDCQWIAIGKQKRQEKDRCIRCGSPRPHKNKKYCNAECYSKSLRERESILTKKEYQKVRNKILAREHRENLTDYYVKKTLAHYRLKKVPAPLIKSKRVHLKLKRLIRSDNYEKNSRKPT